MEFCFEFWAMNDQVHDMIEVVAWSMEDAEDRVAVFLRERFGEDFRITGARGISPLCLA